jgi:hypothetical protein
MILVVNLRDCGKVFDILQVSRVRKKRTLLVPDSQVAALIAIIAGSCPGTELMAATSSGVRTPARASSAASQLWHSPTKSAKVTTQTTSVKNSSELRKSLAYCYAVDYGKTN